MDDPLVSIVVPAYNEAATIQEVLHRLDRVPFRCEVIVVDDGSTDGTPDLVAGVDGVRLIRRPRNAGKGVAVRDGIAATSGSIVVIQDADLEYNPKTCPRCSARCSRTAPTPSTAPACAEGSPSGRTSSGTTRATGSSRC